MKQIQKQVDTVYGEIRVVLNQARTTVYKTANFTMVMAYWHIGKIIVEEELKGKKRAEYGEYLVSELSKKLTREYGIGFTERNLWYIRQFYLSFRNMNALRSELSWTHYRLLLKIEKEEIRNFYLYEAINSNWSTRELERQTNSLLYERIVMSKDKKKIKELSTKGIIIQQPSDIIKDPYVLEFLGIKENQNYLEKDLERFLLDKLKDFLLELGKGFSFVSRQKRMTIDGEHYYVDLVFYNYILKCFVLIDLKVGKLVHQDIGQMDFYVRYFEEKVKGREDHSTIGLILCSDKNEAMVKYTLLNESRNIFASKYKLYLPTEEELKREIARERNLIEQEKRLQGGIS